MSAISDFVKEAVETCAGSIGYASRVTGIERKTIRRWIEGRCVPKKRSLANFADMLNIDVPPECMEEAGKTMARHDTHSENKVQRGEKYGDMNPVKSICWWCRNAVPRANKRTCRYETGCSWSMYFLPVEGWETRRSGNGESVVYCPQFVQDEESASDDDDDGGD